MEDRVLVGGGGRIKEIKVRVYGESTQIKVRVYGESTSDTYMK
jgi:hypothetical protein